MDESKLKTIENVIEAITVIQKMDGKYILTMEIIKPLAESIVILAKEIQTLKEFQPFVHPRNDYFSEDILISGLDKGY